MSIHLIDKYDGMTVFENTDRQMGLKQENLVFIGGAPRSGTTLVQRMLSQHPTVYAGPEFDLMPAVASLHRDICGRVQSGRVSQLTDEESVNRASSDFVLSLFRDKLNTEGVTHFSEKTPSNSLVFSELLTFLPKSKLILVLRDPVDIERSMKAVVERYKAADKSPPAEIKQITSRVRTIAMHQHRGLLAVDSNQLLVVHYEDILADKVRSAKRICEHIGLEYHSSMVMLDGVQFEPPENDDQLWYTRDQLSAGICQKRLSSYASSRYENYLFDKYIQHDKFPHLERYKRAGVGGKYIEFLFLVREWLTSRSRERKELIGNLKNSIINSLPIK